MTDKTMYDYATAKATKTQDAAKDLERIEQDVVAEAEASVEDFDAMGNEQAAAEAAETAFTFKEVQE